MSTKTRRAHVNFPAGWAKAIRADALSGLSSDIERTRLGLAQKIITPHRVTIRVGTYYPNHPARRTISHPIIDYVKTPPFCEACGRRIQNAQRAVKFRWRPTGRGWGRTRYIHENCPEEAHTQ